ncbi:MAG TPA: hypothetical protein VGC49_10075 [Solirubrobacterales bacterium]|jgi:hypothetical protein
MIAAAKRRRGKPVRRAPATARKWSRRADRAANRILERADPLLLRAGYLAGSSFDAVIRPPALGLRRLGGWLRPWASRFFRLLAHLERGAGRALGLAARSATALAEVVTPRRAVAAAIVAAAACLVVSQFLDYHGVEVGQPGYAGLPDVAKPPTVDLKTAGQAHAYLLVPLGAVAGLLGLVGAWRERPRLGLAVAALGLVSLVVILLVDLPSGLDAGAQTSRFAGASAVLEEGFYAELAAGAGLLMAGLLYYARPCRIRINSSGRAASGRRRRPRPRASSRGRVARSA